MKTHFHHPVWGLLTKFSFIVSVCFKVFDSDQDGYLSRAEVRVMLECMLQVQRQTQQLVNGTQVEVAELESQVFSFSRLVFYAPSSCTQFWASREKYKFFKLIFKSCSERELL